MSYPRWPNSSLLCKVRLRLVRLSNNQYRKPVTLQSCNIQPTDFETQKTIL